MVLKQIQIFQMLSFLSLFSSKQVCVLFFCMDTASLYRVWPAGTGEAWRAGLNSQRSLSAAEPFHIQILRTAGRSSAV